MMIGIQYELYKEKICVRFGEKQWQRSVVLLCMQAYGSPVKMQLRFQCYFNEITVKSQ